MMKKKGAMLLIAGALAMPMATTFGAEAEDLIKYRKNVMKVIGGHTGSLFAIAGGKAGESSHMEAHVRGLAAASMLVKDIFPPESEEGETRAKPDIWMDPDGFAAAVSEVEDAAAGVLAAFESGGDMGAALNTLGKACKGCHDNYRSD